MAMLPITTGSYFAPINIGGGPQLNREKAEGLSSFGEMLNSYMSEIDSLEAQKKQDSYRLSIGDVDDIAAIELTSQKAQTMLTMFVQVRNSLVDSYNEIMRMNV